MLYISHFQLKVVLNNKKCCNLKEFKIVDSSNISFEDDAHFAGLHSHPSR